jgi:hypothetical protein
VVCLCSDQSGQSKFTTAFMVLFISLVVNYPLAGSVLRCES